MKKVWLDLETRCALDLTKVGSYRYAEHESFRILMCGYAIDDGPVKVASGLGLLEEIDPLFERDDVYYIAHNTGFDRIALSAHLGLPTGVYLDPSRWIDTAVLAATESFPSGLDKLTKLLRVSEKDSAGTRLINLFSKPNRKGGWNDETTHPEEWKLFLQYCGNDVEAMRDATRYLHKQSETERAIWIADQKINDRGVRIDVPMAQAAVLADADNKAAARSEVIELTGVDNPGSVQQLTAWFSSTGIDVTSLKKDTVTELLAGELTLVQRRVLELRQELALASAPGKFKAAVAMACSDGRVRGTAKYYGAHTGRWSGRGIQLQNQPRASLGRREALALFDLMAGLGASPQELKALVRPLLLGPLTIVDYSQIEARVIAWLAGEQWVLDAFTQGRDIYVETAKRMNMPDPTGAGRQSGKSAVLGFGFGGGPDAARNVGAKGTDEELETLVRQYRGANPKIQQFWYDLWEAFVHGGECGRISVERRSDTRRVRLPSGREIVYRGVVARRVMRVSQRTGREYPAWDVINRQPTGKIARLWSGTIAENVTQATARDLMARCLPVLEDRGIPVVAHIHDEIIADGDHLAEMEAVMLDSPDWADGLPVAAEGKVVERYTKG